MQITVPDKEISRPYWPRELRTSGYVGSLKIYMGVCVLVIPKPGAADRDIAKGLELLAEQFKYEAGIKGTSKQSQIEK